MCLCVSVLRVCGTWRTTLPVRQHDSTLRQSKLNGMKWIYFCRSNHSPGWLTHLNEMRDPGSQFEGDVEVVNDINCSTGTHLSARPPATECSRSLCAQNTQTQRHSSIKPWMKNNLSLKRKSITFADRWDYKSELMNKECQNFLFCHGKRAKCGMLLLLFMLLYP